VRGRTLARALMWSWIMGMVGVFAESFSSTRGVFVHFVHDFGLSMLVFWVAGWKDRG
jgi:hypothetical protein